MSDAIKGEDLKLHTGLFCWNGDKLRASIKLVKPDYDERDPATWPLFDLAHIEDAIGGPYEGSGPALPVRVAYSIVVMERYLAKHPEAKGSMVNLHPTLHASGFRDYPLNLTRFGNLHRCQGIEQSAYEDWLRAFGAKQQPNLQTRNEVQPATSATIPNTGAAYNKIMKTLASKAGAPTKITQLQKQLAEAQSKIGEQTQRAETAETKTKDLKQQLTTSKSQLTKQTKKTTTAETKINELEQQLKKRNDEHDAARKEANESNQRIVNIWNELEKMNTSGQASNPGSLKRDLSQTGLHMGTDGSPSKKPKSDR